ncbi:MAG: membrane protein insertion efficiency factor YidD [Parcubacteria group bacterium]
MKRIFLQTISLYQKTMSPVLHDFLGDTAGCRFYPTCSEYGHQAIQKYGVLKGASKTAFRILKCNPLSRGGVDLV